MANVPDGDQRPNVSPSTFSTVLVVSAFLLFVGWLVLSALGSQHGSHLPPPATMEVQALYFGLRAYRDDFGAYPPDELPGHSSGAVLYHFLCERFGCTEDGNGPYLNARSTCVGTKDNAGWPEYRSPYGGEYVYKVLRKPDGMQDVLIIEPGRDGLLGGTIDPQKGFIPDETIRNSHGDPAWKDNISSSQP